MKKKIHILGVLAALCLLGTGYYAWTLYDAHLKQVAEWNEDAKAAFEEALWMEVNKRAEIPFYRYSSGLEGNATLIEGIPDSVSVITMEGFRKYKIDRDRYENSLIKESVRRGDLGFLLEEYPLSIDTLSTLWNGLLQSKPFSGQTQIRYIYTNLNLNNDTIFSMVEKRFSPLDSLTVKYLGYRCEHEVTAYVSYPYWMANITRGDGCILSLPWLLLVLLSVCYPKLEALAKHKLIHKEMIEKTVEIEKEIIVENKIRLADVKIDKVRVFELPDGTVFDTFTCTLTREGLQQRLQPQSVSLLMLFLKEDNHKVASDTISEKLWGEPGLSERIYSATRRLRNDLKKVNSELVIECSYGVYELKSPISSKKSDQT